MGYSEITGGIDGSIAQHKKLNLMFRELYETTENTDLEVSSIEYSDTYWDDLRVPVFSTKKGGTKDPDFAKIADDGSGSQGVFTFLFDKTTEEELYFAVQIPHNWKYGTNIHAHVHWSPVANGASGKKVSWGLEYSFAEIGNVFSDTTIAYGDAHVPADDSLVAYQHYLTEIAEIDMSAVDSVSSMLICRVFRDAGAVGGTDDYDDDTGLLEIDFHYEIDSPGSRGEYDK